MDIKQVQKKLKRFTLNSLVKDFNFSEKDALEICSQADTIESIEKFFNVQCPVCAMTAWSVSSKDWPKVNSGWCDECGTECPKATSKITILYVTKTQKI
jgi:hypothetical protein